VGKLIRYTGTGLSFLLMCGACTVDLSTRPSARVDDVWFEDLARGEPLKLSEEEQRALIDLAESQLRGKRDPTGKLLPRLQADSAPRIVFVTVSDGRTPGRK